MAKVKFTNLYKLVPEKKKIFSKINFLIKNSKFIGGKEVKLFEKNLGYNSKFFSYPFGEYSLKFKRIIENLNFKYAFGQHSGVADETKDFFELPRFPINEKYGEIKRFKTILKTLPFPYEKITPEDRYLKNESNPPEVKIKFFENLINIKNINCYSNEGNVWRKSDIQFILSLIHI